MPRCIETEEQKQQYKFIIQCLADGDTYIDIANNTGLDYRYVRNKTEYLLRRYGVRTNAHLVAKAFRKGVIQ